MFYNQKEKQQNIHPCLFPYYTLKSEHMLTIYVRFIPLFPSFKDAKFVLWEIDGC